MHRASAFSQLLEAKLQEVSGNQSARPSSSRARGFTPPHPLLFSTPYRFDRRASACVAPVLEDTPAPLRLPPAKRTLSPQEQFALDTLNTFGAALTADSTAAELRSAYRALAREYHPDRHPCCRPDETRRLADSFALVTAAHRELARVIN